MQTVSNTKKYYLLKQGCWIPAYHRPALSLSDLIQPINIPVKYWIVPFSIMFLLLCSITPAKGQDYKKMREEIIQKQRNTRAEIIELNNQIDEFQERLNLAEQKYDRLLRQYENLKRVIALQEQKISKLELEQQQIQEEISLTAREIIQNEQQLKELTERYEKTLSYVYKHGRASQLALIMSSASINQMLVRSHYLDKFETYRQDQARQLNNTRQRLVQNKEQLEQGKEKNKAVLAEIQAEKEEQIEKRRLQEKNVAILRSDRQQIQERLGEVQRQKDKLNNVLTSLILEEERVRKEQEARIRRMEEARRQRLAEARAIVDEEERAREVARYSKPIPSAGFMDEATLSEIEQSFAAAKGKLPWPVDSSTISERFGRRRHPIYGTITPNLGIEIVTKSQDPVRVIHDGLVIAILPMTGFGDVVVVKHGKFFTAYGNLSRVLTREQAHLSEGEIIGLAGDENSARGESVFFMVRENNTNLDPEDWIVEK